MEAVRTILHVDMDAFFASVEQLDDPACRGKAVLVGHEGRRGVVAAASYEAREHGCHSAMPMAVAKRRCPQAIVKPSRPARYGELSREIFTIFHDYTPRVEPLSIDEAFLDLTGSERLLGEGPEVAAALRARIRSQTGLTASVGVAPNKFLAKLASDMDKPDGLTVISRERIREILPPLPIRKMWGVGPATERRLLTLGIHTFGDVERFPVEVLRREVGQLGERIHRLARGIDNRPVVPDHEAKSISQEQTFGHDLTDPEAVRPVLLHQTEQVARRLRRQGLKARRVTLKIRYGDFETITRSRVLPAPTAHTRDLWQVAWALFGHWARASFRPVRLIGMSTTDFDREEQLRLFTDEEDQRQDRLDEATDAIRNKFGKGAIRLGGTLGGARGRVPRPLHTQIREEEDG